MALTDDSALLREEMAAKQAELLADAVVEQTKCGNRQMITQHTPEPWIARWDLVIFPGEHGGFSLAGCRRPSADAARIVACVNACAGIPTGEMGFSVRQLQADYLKINILAASLTSQLEKQQVRASELEQQRDELRAKYDELLAALLEYGEHRANPKLCEMYRNPSKMVCTCGLDAAIAKHRGQQL